MQTIDDALAIISNMINGEHTTSREDASLDALVKLVKNHRGTLQKLEEARLRQEAQEAKMRAQADVLEGIRMVCDGLSKLSTVCNGVKGYELVVAEKQFYQMQAALGCQPYMGPQSNMVLAPSFNYQGLVVRARP